MDSFKDTLDAVDAIRDAGTLEAIARCLGWPDRRVILAAAAIIQASQQIDCETEKN
jgi:hypothetical protein